MSRKLLAVVLTLVLAAWLLQGCGQSVGKMTPTTASTLRPQQTFCVPYASASNLFAHCRSNLGADCQHLQMALGVQANWSQGLQADSAVLAHADGGTRVPWLAN